jgi:hypothetical protein
MRQAAQEHPAISHNRQAWEEIAAAHAEELLEVVAANLHRNPTRYLEEPLRKALDTVGIDGSVLAQFNCNNGRELVSAVNHGARTGYGFDISSNYIEQARWLAASCGTNATFVANDEGTLILYETHPFAEMLKPDVTRSDEEPLVPHYSYNTGKPRDVEKFDPHPPLSMLLRFTLEQK